MHNQGGGDDASGTGTRCARRMAAAWRKRRLRNRARSRAGKVAGWKKDRKEERKKWDGKMGFGP